MNEKKVSGNSRIPYVCEALFIDFPKTHDTRRIKWLKTKDID